MHKKYQKVKQFLLCLMLVNSITYTGARCFWYLTGGVAAELKVVRAVGDSGIMNYFIAGNVNQPDTAFKFLEDKVDGGITYVIYPRARGCSMRQIANQVLADAKQQNCQVRTFGISLGDYVSRFVEAELPNAETIGVICSKNDEFLQNDVIAEYFQGVPIAMIDSSHGNTQGSPEAYAAALDLLMLKA